MSDPKLYLGIALALCSCVSSATGYTLQKVAHNKAAVSKAKAAASSPAHTPRQGSPSPKSTANGTPRNVDVNVWTPSGVRGPATGEGTGKEEDNRAEGKVGAPPFPPEHESRVAILPETEEVPAETDVEKAKGYKRFWQFYAGLVLLIVGTVFSAFVFGLAPQSTLAPLGSVTMIVNAILSWKYLGETFGRIDFASVVLMAVGTTVAVLFGRSNDPTYTLTDIDNLFIKRPASWVLAIISGAAIVVGTVFVYTVGKKPVVEMRPILRGLDAFTRAFLGAAWSGYSNYASKAVIEVLFTAVKHKTVSDIGKPEFYLYLFVMVFALVMQVKFLNFGLSKYDAIIIVRLYQAMLAIFSSLSGFFYYDEIARISDFAIGMFCLGVCIVLMGIVVGMFRKPKEAYEAAAAVATEIAVNTMESPPEAVVSLDDPPAPRTQSANAMAVAPVPASPPRFLPPITSLHKSSESVDSLAPILPAHMAVEKTPSSPLVPIITAAAGPLYPDDSPTSIAGPDAIVTAPIPLPVPIPDDEPHHADTNTVDWSAI